MRRAKNRPAPRLLHVSKESVVLRRTKIVRNMLGKNYYVYSGNNYISVAAVPLRLGTKFGEYCFTRRPTQHMKKKKKKSKK